MGGDTVTWSYTRWSDYATCPALYKFKYLDKIPTPKNAAMARGTKIHELAEAYVRKQIGGLPKELARFAAAFQKLRAKAETVAEQEWGFTRAWEPTGYFAPDVWLRAKCDAAVPLKSKVTVIDYKTGREYPSHVQQTSLYALAAFQQYPQVARVQTQFWYLDDGHQVDEVFTKAELPVMREVWEERVTPMEADTEFTPTPGEACRKYSGCPMGKSKGGPCAFG